MSEDLAEVTLLINLYFDGAGNGIADKLEKKFAHTGGENT